MTVMKRLADITTRKVLMAAAVLASLTAAVSAAHNCYFWFHQPKMPESVRQMSKLKD